MMLARKTQKMNDKKPDKTKPAATILLLRDVADHLEVLMIVRSDKMHFQSALVFPGGKIDDSDNDPDLAPYIGGAEGLSPKQRATRVGAIREAFEEAGILLARPRDGDTLVDAARLKDLRPRYRKDLFEGKISLREMAEKENLVFACDQLVHFAHWIPPAHVPVRFDTHFYVARAPEDQLSIHDGTETVETLWIDPADAIAEADAGKRTLVFPTRMNVLKLGRNRNVEEALDRTRNAKVVTVQPVLEERPEGKVLCIPAEADYDVTEIAFDKVPRANFPGA